MILTTIELTEKAELEFEVNVGGITNTADSVRFVIEGADCDYSCKCRQINENTLKVVIPKMEGILSPGVYSARMELVVDGKVYTPLVENIEFVPEAEFTAFRRRVELDDDLDTLTESKKQNKKKDIRKSIADKFASLMEDTNTDEFIEEYKAANILKKSNNGYVIRKAGDVYLIEDASGAVIKSGTKLEIMLEWDILKSKGKIGSEILNNIMIEDEDRSKDSGIPPKPSFSAGTKPEKSWIDIARDSITNPANARKKKATERWMLQDEEDGEEDKVTKVTKPVPPKPVPPKPVPPKPITKQNDLKSSAKNIALLANTKSSDTSNHKKKVSNIEDNKPEHSKNPISYQSAKKMYQKLLDYQKQLIDIMKNEKPN